MPGGAVSAGFQKAAARPAASDWDGEMEVMRVRPSRADSYERLFHDAGVERGLVEFRRHEALRRRLIEPRLERFIGVIYRPVALRRGFATQQFDGFVWLDETRAVTRLGPKHRRTGFRIPIHSDFDAPAPSHAPRVFGWRRPPTARGSPYRVACESPVVLPSSSASRSLLGFVPGG
jgi:hypothetical protein